MRRLQENSVSTTGELIPSASQDAPGWEDAPFLAELTAVTAGSGSLSGYWLYSWSEQTTDAVTGLPVAASPGRWGTATSSPALENNNAHLTTFPVYVTMRLRGYPQGAPIYQFDEPGSLASFNLVVGPATGPVTQIDADGIFNVMTWQAISATEAAIRSSNSAIGNSGVQLAAATAGSQGGSTIKIQSSSNAGPGQYTYIEANGNGTGATNAPPTFDLFAPPTDAGGTSWQAYVRITDGAAAGSFASGVTGKGGGGDTFTGGICTGLGSGGGSGLTVGTTAISGGTSGRVLYDNFGILGELATPDSVIVSSGNLQLSGDSASPGNSYYYGTNASGTKGFYALPSSSGPTGTNGQNQLSSSYATTHAFANVGLSVSLPSAGTYFIYATIRGVVTITGANCGISAALNDGSLIPASMVQVVGDNIGGGTPIFGQVPLFWIYTASGAKTINLQAAYFSTGVPALADILAYGFDNEGNTSMGYIKIA